MTPSHHPSDSILVGYAAGALEPGFGLVTRAHIEVCAACRARAATLEAASGEALAALRPAEVASDSLKRVLTRIDAPDTEHVARDIRPLAERLPLLGRKWVAPGVWVAAVDTPHAPQNRVYVLSVDPGMPTAQHTHSGAEFCTVLRGAYRDELGVFRAGDFAAADGALEHRPVVEGNEPCVCLFATEGRLKPRGLIGRIAFGLADV
jgi:putative transcriptional regulator